MIRKYHEVMNGLRSVSAVQRTRLLMAACVLFASLIASQTPVSAQSELMPGKYDDLNENISYLYAGNPQYGEQYYGGSTYAVGASGAWIAFDFFGDYLTLIIVTTQFGGTGDLCIDSSCQSLSFYSASPIYQVPVTISGLGVGSHSLTITQVSGAIYFDAVEIFSSVEPSPTPLPTAEPPAYQVLETYQDFEGNDVVVMQEYSITAGEVLIAVLLFGIFVLVVFVAGTWIVITIGGL